ncbi:MAG: DUF3418 domain-containing protein, partial [Proteobacteria bacterium]|nr:DUF3418 domain-containing protein [Pseudomonadota bacterium]
AKPSPFASAMTELLGQLVFKGFLQKTPWEQLPRLPIYVKAMRIRAEKRVANPQRDGQRGAEINELFKRWEAEMLKWEKEGRDTAALAPFRWMIEELRVGLFAQELKTPYPVSVKRLTKVFEDLTKR